MGFTEDELSVSPYLEQAITVGTKVTPSIEHPSV